MSLFTFVFCICLAEDSIYHNLDHLREIGVPINEAITPPPDLSAGNQSHCGVNAAFAVIRLLGERRSYGPFVQAHAASDPKGLATEEVLEVLKEHGVSASAREVNAADLAFLPVPFIAREESENAAGNQYNVVLQYDADLDEFSVLSASSFTVGSMTAEAVRRSFAGQVIVIENGYYNSPGKSYLAIVLAVIGTSALAWSLTRVGLQYGRST